MVPFRFISLSFRPNSIESNYKLPYIECVLLAMYCVCTLWCCLLALSCLSCKGSAQGFFSYEFTRILSFPFTNFPTSTELLNYFNLTLFCFFLLLFVFFYYFVHLRTDLFEPSITVLVCMCVCVCVFDKKK